SLNGQVMDVDAFLKQSHDAINKGYATNFFGETAVVGNQVLLDRFNKLFLYAPKESKGKYLYAFLLILTQQKETYSYQGNAEAQGDVALSGFDLFKKYIAFDMAGVTPYTPKPKELSYYYTSLQEDVYAVKKKDKITTLDEVLCYFAVKLHKAGQFNLARDVYNLYLAQQSSITYLDTILVRYYQTLAGSNCINPDEIIYSSQKFDCDPIGIDLVDYDGPEYDAFSNYMTHKERDRAKYQATYDEVKKIFTLRPAATFAALSKLEQAQKEINKKFEDIKVDGASQELINTLKTDLKTELSTLEKEIKGLKSADKACKAIAGNKDVGKAAIRLYDAASGSLAARRDAAIAKLKEYYKIVEQWGDASDIDQAKSWAVSVKREIERIYSQENNAKIAAEKREIAQVKRARARDARAERMHIYLRIILSIFIFGLLGVSLYFQITSGYISTLFSPLLEGSLFQLESSASDVLTGFFSYLSSPWLWIAIASSLVAGFLIFWLTRICETDGYNIFLKIIGYVAILPTVAFGVILIADGIYTEVVLGLLNCLTCACFNDMCNTCESCWDLCYNWLESCECGCGEDCVCANMSVALGALGQGLLILLQGLLLIVVGGVSSLGNTLSIAINRD
ncbi:MAG: hypothetical protein J5736_05090, partial [Bacilli bacterium]|nr:hypothetical protein [Bacilli bacterium]